MAIVKMVSRDMIGQPGVYELNNYRGAEKGRVYHGRECPHSKASTADLSGQLSSECVTAGIGQCIVHDGLVMQRSHEGLVLSLGEYNGYDDSDFYAVVWNEDKGHPEQVTYGTTRAWTYPNSASVDATPEVRAKAQAWYDQQAKIQQAAAAAAAVEREKRRVALGKVMQVVRGKKVPKGTVGKVFWMRDGRVGLALDDSKDANGRYANVAWVPAEYLYEAE